ncbi:hypothetical protein PInf_008114 [Phytophthora infestans]|nr:hypothetical protein PInf_007951 [Phytophthora infestans]KAI9982219.1 hypothetical protein PInf_008114 [Phytophthora infestans]
MDNWDEAKEVGKVLADIVASIVASDSEVTTRASVSPPVPAQTQPSSRSRRRAVLREESAGDKKSLGDDPMPSPASLVECIVDGDANRMASGAAQCTGLSSDEEQESEEDDDDDDNWVEDWDIGKLTDGDAEKDGGSPGIGVPVGGEGQAEDLQDESGRILQSLALTRAITAFMMAHMDQVIV